MATLPVNSLRKYRATNTDSVLSEVRDYWDRLLGAADPHARPADLICCSTAGC